MAGLAVTPIVRREGEGERCNTLHVQKSINKNICSTTAFDRRKNKYLPGNEAASYSQTTKNLLRETYFTDCLCWVPRIAL